jgi:hypothetical protein
MAKRILIVEDQEDNRMIMRTTALANLTQIMCVDGRSQWERSGRNDGKDAGVMTY